MIRSFCVVCFALALIVVLGCPLLLYTVVSGNSNLIYRVGVLGARLAVRLAGVRLMVRGREKIPVQRAVVFMANHQSNCDPPAVIGLLPPVLMLAKEEFFRVPILGHAMRLRGFVPVDRKSREKAIRAIDRAAAALASGYSFLVFPEGTRSEDGRLLPFKKGVFIMAVKAGAPIVPISISGSRKIMPKGKATIRPGRVRITFHDPVVTEGVALEQTGAVQEAVRNAILSGLSEEEMPPSEDGRARF
ncbi:MAG: lysophospholipid acyltransferase family protein [Terriglobia bacterium]